MNGESLEIAWWSGERGFAAVFSVAVLGAVLYPLGQYRKPLSERVDGFPLSWYPMFSARRRRHCRIAYAVGVQYDGSRRCLPRSALGTGGINQVRRQLNRVAVTEWRADAYAAGLARRVAGRSDCRDVVRVEVVRGRFDLDRCLLERIVRCEETVLATASVHRPPAPAGRIAAPTPLGIGATS